MDKSTSLGALDWVGDCETQEESNTTESHLRRQAHTQVAISPTMVLTTDPQTVSYPENSATAPFGFSSITSTICQGIHRRIHIAYSIYSYSIQAYRPWFRVWTLKWPVKHIQPLLGCGREPLEVTLPNSVRL